MKEYMISGSGWQKVESRSKRLRCAHHAVPQIDYPPAWEQPLLQPRTDDDMIQNCFVPLVFHGIITPLDLAKTYQIEG